MPENIILDALNLTRTSPTTYTTKIGQEHRFGAFLHGGFAAALLVHTALEHVKTTLERKTEQHVVACHVQYLRPVNQAEISLLVEAVRVTKVNVTLHVVLSQKGAPSVTGDVNLVDASANRGTTTALPLALHPPPTPFTRPPRPSTTDPKWILYHLPYSATSQGQPLAHWNLYFTRAGPSSPTIHDMWLTPHNPSTRITTIMLPLIADVFLRQADNFLPNADFSYNACLRRAERANDEGEVRQDDLDKAVTRYWTATASLSLEVVRQLPEEGVKWILLRSEAKAIRDGRLVCEVTLVDEEGALVAYGKVVDQLIPAGKWVVEEERQVAGGGARIMKM